MRDDRHVVIYLNPRRHGHNQTSSWLERGEPAPIAWIVAAEPVVHLASVGAVFPGVQEIEIAGGLKGEPIELVKCVTSDIMVPANAEMIIEGELLPGEGRIDVEGIGAGAALDRLVLVFELVELAPIEPDPAERKYGHPEHSQRGANPEDPAP